MEEWASLVLTTLGVVTAAVLLFQWIRTSASRRLKLPPGPRPLPVLGNLLLLASLKSKHRELYKLANKYGPIMWLRLGSQGAVVVQSPELAMEVLKHQDRVFASRPPPSYAIRIINNDAQDVIFAPHGSHWRFMRKLMSMELLTHRRIDDFQHVRAEEVGRMVQAIKSHFGQPVNLTYLLHTLSLNNITRMVMSKAAVSSYEVVDREKRVAAGSGTTSGTTTESSIGKIEKDHIEDHELIALIKAGVDMSGLQGIGEAIPWLSFLDRWFILPTAKLKQIKRQLNNYYYKTIQEHRLHREATPDPHDQGKPRDFVDVLLDITPADMDGAAVTDDTIACQIGDMVAAGSDTIAMTAEWAMSELLRQPALLEQAVQELDRVVGTNRAVAETDIPNLPYLQAVVKETLRVHPSAPFLVPHYSTHATTVAGYHIPAGTTLLVNVWALSHDPDFWEDPDKFRPHRFLLPDGTARLEVDVRGRHFQLLPFGSGMRMCPGLGLGLTMVHLTLATLLHTFTWSLPPNVKRPEDLDMSEKEGLAVFKAVSLKAVPHPKLVSASP